MLPKTLDEIKAEEENEQLSKEIMPRVSDTDNHQTHIYTHYMVSPKTHATWFHIAEHEDMLAKQQREESVQQAEGQINQINPTKEKKSPVEAATPLKTEVKSTLSNTER